jgi:hypothetical protein
MQDAIDRYIAGTYPEIEKQQRQHRSVTVQIERLTDQVAELQEDKKMLESHVLSSKSKKTS